MHGNKVDKPEQAEELTMEFAVKSKTDSRIDASVVGKSVTATDSILKELHDEFSQNSVLLLKARPFKEGSFEIPIEIIVVTTGALVNFPIIEDMLKCLTEYFRLKRELKGLAPRIHDGKVIIENSQIAVDKIVVNLLDPGNKSNKLVASAFEAIEKDDNITRFTLTRRRGPLAKIEREEFKYYRGSVREKRCREVTIAETLDVLGLMFDETGKWTFRRKGKTIPATISDKEFLKQTVIQNGEPFRSGDKLYVDLVVEQEYDESLGDYVDKRFTVAKIRRHIRRTETGELF